MKRVGRMHQHDMTSASATAEGEVWRCDCGTELISALKGDPKKLGWSLLQEYGSILVEYSSKDEGEPAVGRWDPSMRPVATPTATPAAEPTVESGTSEE